MKHYFKNNTIKVHNHESIDKLKLLSNLIYHVKHKS